MIFWKFYGNAVHATFGVGKKKYKLPEEKQEYRNYNRSKRWSTL